MILLVLAFLGGILTILSPCILPVLPFVLTRADLPFRRSGLPLLAGMAITFALVASLAAVGGGWVVRLNEYGRWIALGLVILFGLALLLPKFAERLMRPLVAVGGRLSAVAGAGSSLGSSLALGVATGLLWAPCAGPILGLILTGAAIRGASAETSLLLLAYALGSALSLSAVLLTSGRVLNALKRSLHVEAWIRRGLGGAVLVGAAAIALGLDTGFLARVSTLSSTRLESVLVGYLTSDTRRDLGGDDSVVSGAPSMIGSAMMASTQDGRGTFGDLATTPSLDGATLWLNTEPLSAEALRGKIVLVDFWTYSCINCIRSLPYVKAWYSKYKDQGLIVVGVHSPEFAFERDPNKVRHQVEELGIDYPVAIDNEFLIWRAFANGYWPAHYLFDATGQLRYTHFGEGDYEESERRIQELIGEAGNPVVSGLVQPRGGGAALASNQLDVLSPETYVGYARASNFASEGGLQPEMPYAYSMPSRLALNQWALGGTWTIGEEAGVLGAAPGSVAFRFQARDLHLVLGPGSADGAVRFRVSIDGAPPGDDHGVDVGADGVGTVDEYRLYQLIRQTDGVRTHTFEIQFQDPGVAVYAFTFG